VRLVVVLMYLARPRDRHSAVDDQPSIGQREHAKYRFDPPDPIA
jgi:hypothetical protein